MTSRRSFLKRVAATLGGAAAVTAVTPKTEPRKPAPTVATPPAKPRAPALHHLSLAMLRDNAVPHHTHNGRPVYAMKGDTLGHPGFVRV